MVVYTHNPFAGPLVLLIWGIDIFLLMVMIRLVMESLTIQLNSALYRHIRQITGPDAFMASCRVFLSTVTSTWADSRANLAPPDSNPPSTNCQKPISQ